MKPQTTKDRSDDWPRWVLLAILWTAIILAVSAEYFWPTHPNVSFWARERVLITFLVAGAALAFLAVLLQALARLLESQHVLLTLPERLDSFDARLHAIEDRQLGFERQFQNILTELRELRIAKDSVHEPIISIPGITEIRVNGSDRIRAQEKINH